MATLPRSLLRGFALGLALGFLVACAPTARPPADELSAYDSCAAAAAPWAKVRDEIIQFSREGVSLPTALDVLIITARTAAGERPIIRSDEVANALSRHVWRGASTNPLHDWAERNQREPLLTIRRCLAERYRFKFPEDPTR